MQPKAIAFFDFDGTLCSGDSIFPFLLFATQNGYAPKLQLLKALRGYLAQLAHTERVVKSKEDALSFIQGKSQKEMDEIARCFFNKVLCPRFFADGQKEMEKRKAEGKEIVIVTASPDVYMRVLPEFMPLIDAVIATRCIVDERGIYTGRIESNCRGTEKTVMIERYLSQREYELDRANSYAYGDSLSDSHMLQMIAHPVAVNAKAGLIDAVSSAESVSWR